MLNSDKNLVREIDKAQQQNLAEIEKGRREATKASSTTRRRGRPAGVRWPRVSGTKMSRVKAPRTASQFHYEHKYANRKNNRTKGPRSPVAKVRYDFDLKNTSGESRVGFAYTYSAKKLPLDALNPLNMAFACESRDCRVDARLMAHDTLAIPFQLNAGQREELTKRIAAAIAEIMGTDVVYVALHNPDDGNDDRNYHLHISYPLRKIESSSDPEPFSLGRKIIFEAQPAQRRAAGLEPTMHNDLKRLRGRLAGLCADALADTDEGINTQERWRFGYLPLNGLFEDSQTKRAQVRGDWEFVEQNQFREVQRHEGLGAQRLDGPSPTAIHNAQLEEYSPFLLLKKKVIEIILQAQRDHIQEWQQFERLAARQGVKINWNLRRKTGRIQGLSYEWNGLKASGKSIGLSLSKLKKELQIRALVFAETSPGLAEIFMHATKPQKNTVQVDVSDLQIELEHHQQSHEPQQEGNDKTKRWREQAVRGG